MASSILWQHEESAVTLIDIPSSIAVAQGKVQHPYHDVLQSVEPLRTPFASNEPKSALARASLMCKLGQQDLHAEYASLLRHALQVLKTEFVGEFCLPRTFVEPSKKKRKRNEDDLENEEHAQVANVGQSDRDLVDSKHPGATGSNTTQTEMHRLGIRSRRTSQTSTLIDIPSHSGFTFWSNASNEAVKLQFQASTADGVETYRIPPSSSFFLGDCRDGSAFHAALRKQTGTQNARKKFDFILLDPPWPNRSVRRTHKTAGSTYNIMATLQETEDLLCGMKLDMLMAHDCMVGVWITNKAAVRDLVLGENGLFDSSNVQLVEEWIWLKTTVSGEPTAALDGLWRQPYEVLLIGRKRSDATEAECAGDTYLKRKVLVSVPDMHSRKPCLKQLIEPLMPAGYRALEIFSRHLVAGWWSWGNECIKFNCEGYWWKSGNEQDPR